MRIVYMGTPAIAATCLQALHSAGHEIVGVYTKPDTPKNRGMKMACSEVKEYAVNAGLPVYQPATFRDEQTYEELKGLAPDLIAVVAYGKLLPQRVLDIPQYGCINIHASVLPLLRGAGPIQWAILNGFAETGVTAMYMTAQMDAGDIIAVEKTPIDPAETAGELTERLAVLGAELLCRTVASIADGTAARIPQDADAATYAPMLTKDMSPIDWSCTRRQIVDHIRGLNPWPIATAQLGGTLFKIYRAEPLEILTEKAPGQLVSLDKQGLQVACGDGVIRITQLQAQGGKRMAAADYFRGHPIQID